MIFHGSSKKKFPSLLLNPPLLPHWLSVYGSQGLCRGSLGCFFFPQYLLQDWWNFVSRGRWRNTVRGRICSAWFWSCWAFISLVFGCSLAGPVDGDVLVVLCLTWMSGTKSLPFTMPPLPTSKIQTASCICKHRFLTLGHLGTHTAPWPWCCFL